MPKRRFAEPVIFANNIEIANDKKIIGRGQGPLILSGSAHGIKLQGTNIILDGSLVGSTPIKFADDVSGSKRGIFEDGIITAGPIAASGSTTFGNSSDDTHTFTGGVSVTGDISGSASGSFVGGLRTAGPLSVTGSSTFNNNVLPGSDNSVNLGSASKRWANIYTGDLHLKNDRGNWTIVEEEDYLCVINNMTGKKYKMMLQEIDD